MGGFSCPTSALPAGTGIVHDVSGVGSASLIVDADISGPIAGTKISPNFGSQNIVTTGTVTAAGITGTWKDAVTVATTAALAANTYSAGVITMSGNGAVVVDGYSMLLNDSICVRNEATAANNGIYTMTTLGDGGHAAVLTRRSDAATTGQLLALTRVPVINGNRYANRVMVLTTTGTITIGTTGQTWALDAVSRRPPYADTTTPILNWKFAASEGTVNSTVMTSPNQGSGGTATMTMTGTNLYCQPAGASICGEGCLRVGGAVASAYMTAPGAIQTASNTLLVGMWIALETYTAGDCYLIALNVTGGAGGLAYIWRLGITNVGKLFFECNVGGAAKRTIGNTAMSIGTDYYVSGKYDGSNVRVLVNGLDNQNLPTAAPGTISNTGTSPNYTIGNDATALAATAFLGTFEEVSIFNANIFEDSTLTWVRAGQGRARTV